MKERTQELIDRIGGKRGKLSPEEERDEVAAIEELGGRLGMTGFESSGEDKEARLEQARAAGQDPGRYFGETRNQLDDGIRQLEQELRGIETEPPPRIYPRPDEDFVAASERLAADKRNRAEAVRSRLEQLSFDRSRAEEIIKTMEAGITDLAREDLSVRIDLVQRELVDIERQATEAERDVRYTSLMEHSANAQSLANQAKGDWPDIAAAHEAAAKLYAEQAAKVTGLDKLRMDTQNRQRDLEKFRAMVRNLEIYKK